MNGIPKFYREKKIFEEVDDIVNSYNIKSYHNVSYSDKLKICGHLVKHEIDNKCSDWMDALVNESISESISESLIKQSLCDYLHVSMEIDRNIVSHYENLMEEIFDERIEHAETSQKEPRDFD